MLAAPLLACGGGLPRPETTQVVSADYVAVPFAPRAPPVEFVPPSPGRGAVWVDGSWEWMGGRYGWRFGSWMLPPKGARLARWVVVRRAEDGQLFFAPTTWKDAAGKTLDERVFASLLGPSARARSRPISQGGEPERERGPERDRNRPPPPHDTHIDTGDSDE